MEKIMMSTYSSLLCVPCILCKSENVRYFAHDKFRNYLQCETCHLVFVPPSQFMSEADEKRRYDLHTNSPDDLNYRNFLNRLFIPMQKRLEPESCGFDFGSGPQPTLSVMFEDAGHHMTIFDQFYANVPSVMGMQYDFITATEVLEHLRDPVKELERLWACLKDGGLLGIMTNLGIDKEQFSGWYYKNDLTHICFFSESTFAFLAERWGAALTFVDRDVVILQKRNV